jgi:4-alpha-glucanotransferase
VSARGDWGIRASYRDAFSRRRRVSPRVMRAVAEAMGVDEASPGAPDSVRIGQAGGALERPAELVLEDGTTLGAVDRLPPDLPHGYHRLGDQLLLAPPRSCHLPRGLRAWGWVVQLYASRSAASWGIGDFGDLAQLAQMAAGQGAGFLAISPFWAPNPGPEPEPSPYFPSTRRFISPLAVRPSSAPGADAGVAPELERAGRALNADRTIDRFAVLRLKLTALEAAWVTRSRRAWERAGLAAFRHDQEPALRDWAVFATLSELHGPGWRSWPAELRDPASPAVRSAAHRHAERVAFHEWLQWIAARQLADVAGIVSIINDLPVGVDPGGFDAWSWQGQLALGASVGAPPDRFNRSGQDWSLPPFIPHRLRAAGYRPFVETVRAALRSAGGLRIDHVLGLFRLWWVPRGHGPIEGAYVTYHADELLAILAIESVRARAVVIGEDLGTVPRGVRGRLARAGILSTRLLIFERLSPASYPRRSFAGVTTHDLPTIAGAWTRSDLDDQAAAGLRPDPDGLELMRGRIAAAGGLRDDADPADVVLAAHRALAAAPPALVAATLEDALLVHERPNQPGTVASQRPNWSVALPKPIEEIARDPFVARLVEVLRR